MESNTDDSAIKMWRRGKVGLSSVVLTSILLMGGACVRRGAVAIRVQRADYSAAIQQTSDEQLLQNIVRLRYGQTPTFLEITGVVVQLSVETSGNARADFGSSTTGGLGVSRTVSEQPTVTYVPSQGEACVRRFLTPVTPQTLLLLMGIRVELHSCDSSLHSADERP